MEKYHELVAGRVESAQSGVMLYEGERERLSKASGRSESLLPSSQWIILEKSWIFSLEGNDYGTLSRRSTTLGHLSLKFINTISLTK